jgi:type IV secretion system protein VirD4
MPQPSVPPAPGNSRKWRWLVYGLLALIALLLIGNLLGSLGDLREANGAAMGYRSGLGFTSAQVWAVIELDLWALAAVAYLTPRRSNPFGWLGGRQMILAGFAVAILAGRLPLGVLSFAFAFVPPLLTLFILPVLMFIGGVWVIITIGWIVLVVLGLVIGVPMLVANIVFQFEHNVAQFRHAQGFLGQYILRFYFWITGELRRTPPDDSKGARFAVAEEVEPLIRPEGMGFGHVVLGEPPALTLLRLLTDKHVLITASTRSGKGVTLLIPHLLRYEGSAFVLDPKGENARATHRRRSALNDKVHVLDPFGISGKPQSRFNPLSRFTPANMEAESKALAAALVLVKGTGERDHWQASGQQLLATMILYVYASPEFPPASKDLPTVRRLLLGAANETLQAMGKCSLADGLIADLAQSFLKTPERELGSIISTAQRETEILDNPYIVACLSATGPGEEVDFAAWHSGTMTVYLCLAAPKFPVFNRWLRLVLTAALDEMTDTLRPPPRPVCFMLDEIATLGRLEPIENAIGLSAGYGIQLITVWQDVAQMRDIYKGRWASFISNAGVRALFNLDDYETAHYWSNTLGSHDVPTESRQVDIYGYAAGTNQGTARRPLLSADQIMMSYAEGKMLILAQGAHPIEAFRVPYFHDQELRDLWDDPRGPGAPPPPPPRAAWQAAPVRPAAAPSPAAAAPAAEAAPPLADDEELPPPGEAPTPAEPIAGRARTLAERLAQAAAPPLEDEPLPPPGAPGPAAAPPRDAAPPASAMPPLADDEEELPPPPAAPAPEPMKHEFRPPPQPEPPAGNGGSSPPSDDLIRWLKTIPRRSATTGTAGTPATGRSPGGTSPPPAGGSSPSSPPKPRKKP